MRNCEVASPRGASRRHVCAHAPAGVQANEASFFFFFFIELSASIYDPLTGNKHHTLPPTSRSRLRRGGWERAFGSRPRGDTMAPLAPFRFMIWPHGGGNSQVGPTMRGHPAVTPLGKGAVESHCRRLMADTKCRGTLAHEIKAVPKSLPKRGKTK